MDFKDYLKTIKDEDSPSGDFACDALADKGFPWADAEKKGGNAAIFDYLFSAGACTEAIHAFRVTWKRYLRGGT